MRREKLKLVFSRQVDLCNAVVYLEDMLNVQWVGVRIIDRWFNDNSAKKINFNFFCKDNRLKIKLDDSQGNNKTTLIIIY